jgi:uncharacterized protein (TIGR02118 family)
MVLQSFPRVKGYVQTTPLADQGELSIAGMLELYFVEPAAALSVRRSDLPGLLAPGIEVATVITGMERVVMRAADFASRETIKGVYPFRRRSDLSVEAFQHHWWHNHGPIAALTEEALAYTQLHVLADCYDQSQPAFDGITEIYWPDRAAAERAVVSRQMREDQASDAPNFVDMDSIVLFFAEEETILAP